MNSAAHRRLDRVATTTVGELDSRLIATLEGYAYSYHEREKDGYRPSPHYRIFGESPQMQWVHLVSGAPEGRPAENAWEALEANLNAACVRFGTEAVRRGLKELINARQP